MLYKVLSVLIHIYALESKSNQYSVLALKHDFYKFLSDYKTVVQSSR